MTEVGIKALIEPDVDQRKVREEASVIEKALGDISLTPDVSLPDREQAASAAKRGARRAGTFALRRGARRVAGSTGVDALDSLGVGSKGGGGAGGSSGGGGGGVAGDDLVPLAEKRNDLLRELIELFDEDFIEDGGAGEDDDGGSKIFQTIGSLGAGAVGGFLGSKLIDFLRDFKFPKPDVPDLPPLEPPEIPPLKAPDDLPTLQPPEDLPDIDVPPIPPLGLPDAIPDLGLPDDVPDLGVPDDVPPLEIPELPELPIAPPDFPIPIPVGSPSGTGTGTGDGSPDSSPESDPTGYPHGPAVGIPDTKPTGDGNIFPETVRENPKRSALAAGIIGTGAAAGVGLAMADGPLPFGDILGAKVAGTALAAGTGIAATGSAAADEGRNKPASADGSPGTPNASEGSPYRTSGRGNRAAESKQKTDIKVDQTVNVDVPIDQLKRELDRRQKEITDELERKLTRWLEGDRR